MSTIKTLRRLRKGRKVIKSEATGNTSWEKVSWLGVMAAGPIAAYLLTQGVEVDEQDISRALVQITSAASVFFGALSQYRKRGREDRLEMGG